MAGTPLESPLSSLFLHSKAVLRGVSSHATTPFKDKRKHNLDASFSNKFLGWMATSWVYPAEILPLSLRAKGTGLAAAADFLGNFVVVEITPPALKNIGYKTYIIFAVTNIVTAIVCWAFYPETSGLSLESIDMLFVPEAMESDIQEGVLIGKKWYSAAQWDVVPRAWAAVDAAKLRRRNEKLGLAGDVENKGEIVEIETKT
jgi:hypothetical protein